MEQSIFKAYDIRGIYPTELNEADVELIAQAYLKFISETLNKPIKDLKIAVGQDIRKSSEPLMKVAVRIFLSYGVTVYDYGLMSINDYYFVVGYHKYDGGFMATASHNPAEYGGFKMVVDSKKYDDSLEFINGKTLFETLTKLNFPLSDEKIQGKLIKSSFKEDHLQHIFKFIDLKKIKPLTVVVDTGNGMNGLLIPAIFKQLPCKLIHLFPELDGRFPNRCPNPLVENASSKLATKVKEVKADLGVIYDVDGDRMFLVDELGNFIRGDMVLLLLAKAILKEHPGSGIAYNLICSHAVPELITKWGGQPIRSEVGYMNLARHMREHNGIMSGEVSGHFAFRDNYYADSGFISLLLTLEAISEDGRPLSAIIKEFSLYARNDEVNIRVKSIEEKLEKVRQKYKDNIKDEIDGLTVEFNDWWFNVRPSNTEPLLRITVEANNQELVNKYSKDLIKFINN